MSVHSSQNNHVVCVGAVYIDNILTVPHFPHEDSKLRAKNISRRRGGKTANTLQVLAQLIEHDSAPSRQARWTPEDPGTTLHLITVLPDIDSPATKFITTLFPTCNQETRSRTIVSTSPLPEITIDEFKDKIDALVLHSTSQGTAPCRWIHFEGRIPETTLQCVRYLSREHATIKISVECEKPEREGMCEVARLADVVFYSRLWAEKNGVYRDARAFLEGQVERARDGAMLCCTWGAGGATVVQKHGPGSGDWAEFRSWQPAEGDECKAVDTIGAGNTFIAGMLFATNNHADWPLQRKLEFANELAGRKVRQQGFADLGRKMWPPRLET